MNRTASFAALALVAALAGCNNPTPKPSASAPVPSAAATSCTATSCRATPTPSAGRTPTPRRTASLKPTRSARATVKPTPRATPRPSEPVTGVDYANCEELNRDYPAGVPVAHFAYETRLDTDRDGRACEPGQ